MIRRFLRARNLDIEKATNLLLRYLKWRKAFVPDGFISPSLISNQLAQNKLFMQGLDKMGRPIVVCFGGRHKHTSLEEFKRMFSFLTFVCLGLFLRVLISNKFCLYAFYSPHTFTATLLLF